MLSKLLVSLIVLQSLSHSLNTYIYLIIIIIIIITIITIIIIIIIIIINL